MAEPTGTPETNPGGLSQYDKIVFERERLNRAIEGSYEHRRTDKEGKAILQLSFEEVERLRTRVFKAANHLREAEKTLRGYYDPELVALREVISTQEIDDE